MTARSFLLAALLVAAGCEAIPKDQAGTLDRIGAERQFKVGIIASGSSLGLEREQALLDRVANATKARPMIEAGASEPLLVRLEEGQLDLVLGELVPKSPWSTRVTILPPLAEDVTEQGYVHIVAVARNGENAWISLLHREAAAVAGQP